MRLTGLIAAPFTPMHADGEVNLDMIGRLADALVEEGVNGVFLCGTTGESLSLTVEERKAVAERWREVAGDRLTIIVHAGHPCLKDAAELVRHAGAIGADAVGAMPPSFFRPASLDDLIAWCAELASCAPETPFYYYHIPSMTGVDFPMVDFLRRAEGRIPNFAGIKYTHSDLMDYAACVRHAAGGYDVLFGRDEILLSALAVGATGAVGSTYNFAAPIYRRMMEAFAAGDLARAREEQARAAAVVRVFSKYGGLPAQKAIMAMRGLDCGPVRPPLRSLPPDAYRALREELRALGLFPS